MSTSGRAERLSGRAARRRRRDRDATDGEDHVPIGDYRDGQDFDCVEIKTEAQEKIRAELRAEPRAGTGYWAEQSAPLREQQARPGPQAIRVTCWCVIYEKKFDCVEMKRRGQELLRGGWRGWTPEQVAASGGARSRAAGNVRRAREQAGHNRSAPRDLLVIGAPHGIAMTRK